ncbi:hypothetical protein HYH02_013483 [Chlamydomonas schloesseri]|uniref:FAS1 domain-containing protein n=1 Tax=Chlamydomonas schloesseri TaxID=2026947 RepID=A0A835VVN3_9CHLO|nr:hypothetical protein HYH02_013483 [Chlamydomonas schloesseri]|eukprot:KAG2431052.1 hypothetical protein HYH02_013483 [Chlamydomonas schloesseri]
MALQAAGHKYSRPGASRPLRRPLGRLLLSAAASYCCLLLLLTQQTPAQAQPQPSYSSVYDFISQRPDMATLKRLVDGLGLIEQLTNQTFAAFLPDDGAWSRLFSATGTSEASILSGDSGLRDRATSLINFHLVPRMIVPIGTSLSFYTLKVADLAVNSSKSYETQAGRADTDYGLLLTRAGNATDGVGGVQVLGRSGQPAFISINQSDIAAGTSYCNVITGVAQYWFETYYDVLTKSTLSPILATFTAMATSAGQELWLRDTTVFGTLYAADNAAIAKVQKDLGFNMSTAFTQLDAGNFVRYHMTAVPFNRTAVVNPVATKLTNAYLNWNGAQFTSLAGSTGRPTSGVTRYVGFASGASVVPLSESALLPVQGTAWKLLQAKPAATTTTNGFAAFIKALEAQMLIRYQLDDPTKTVTVYAPTDTAFARLEGYLGASFASLSSSYKDQILGMHVTLGTAYTQSSLVTASPVTTMAGARTLSANTRPGGNPAVQLSGAQAPRGAANLIASDNVLYGKSVVHSIDQVLIPADVVLKQGGAAVAAAAPPAWVSLLLAFLAVAVQRWALGRVAAAA